MIGEAVSNSVAAALIGAMSAEEVVTAFDCTFKAPYLERSRHLRRLAELCDSHVTNRLYVRRLIRRIDKLADNLPPPKRRSSDATIAELVLSLSLREQLRMIIEFLQHPRRSRRVSAYRVLKANRQVDFSKALLDSFVQYEDYEAFRTLVLTGAAIWKLPNLETALWQDGERYYQARAIELLWKHDAKSAEELSKAFPMAYIWAAGRRRDESALEFVSEQLREAILQLEKHDTFSLEFSTALSEFRNLIWALGRLGGKQDLLHLASKYRIKLAP